MGSGKVTNFIQSLPEKRENPIFNLEVYDRNSSGPDPRDIDNTFKNICLFDDMVTDSNQTLAEN